MAETNQDIPRWARELAVEVWDRINELVDAGWKTMDIAREVSIPESKVRSLQAYVQRFGPRRRLVQFAKFKDALVSQIEEFGGDMVRSLSVLAALAISNKTKPDTQVRAFEAMTRFTNMLKGMMADDVKDARDTDVRVEVTDKRQKLSDDAIAKIKGIYGLDDDGSGDDSAS